jgi:hypothetical protein
VAKPKKKLFTIGYEQTPASSVLDELERAGVKLLVDVRAVASSRRPGFSKRQLAAGLEERGISYVHLRGLGTPKEGREAARRGKFDTLERIYAAHLKTPRRERKWTNSRRWSRSPARSASSATSAIIYIATGDGSPRSSKNATRSISTIWSRRRREMERIVRARRLVQRAPEARHCDRHRQQHQSN